MKNALFLLSIFVSLVFFARCASNSQVQVAAETTREELPSSQTKQGDRKKTVQAAAKIAGFPLTSPQAIGKRENKAFFSIENEAIEIVYSAKGESGTVTVRKSLGTVDRSGSAIPYQHILFQNDAGTEVMLFGNDLFSRAVWTSGDYSFSIVLKDGAEELSKEEMLALVRSIY